MSPHSARDGVFVSRVKNTVKRASRHLYRQSRRIFPCLTWCSVSVFRCHGLSDTSIFPVRPSTSTSFCRNSSEIHHRHSSLVRRPHRFPSKPRTHDRVDESDDEKSSATWRGIRDGRRRSTTRSCDQLKKYKKTKTLRSFDDVDAVPPRFPGTRVSRRVNNKTVFRVRTACNNYFVYGRTDVPTVFLVFPAGNRRAE